MRKATNSIRNNHTEFSVYRGYDIFLYRNLQYDMRYDILGA